MYDFASAGAIRHLASQGKSVAEIHKLLDFPTPVERIADVVWKYYLEKGIILLQKPEPSQMAEKVIYVKDRDRYGGVTLRRTVEKHSLPKQEYLPCSFGRQKYKNTLEFRQLLNELSESDRSYVLDLPWPLTTVYHVKNERILRIIKILDENDKDRQTRSEERA